MTGTPKDIYARFADAMGAPPRPTDVASELTSLAHAQPAGAVEWALQRPLRTITALPGLSVESTVSGDRLLIHVIGRPPDEPIRVLQNGKLVRETGFGRLSIAAGSQALRNRPSRLIEIGDLPERPVAIEIRVGDKSVHHASFAPLPEEAARQGVASGAFLGTGFGGDLVGWAPLGSDRTGASRVNAVVNGRVQHYLACHTAPSGGPMPPRACRLYRIPQSDLIGGSKGPDGSRTDRIFIFTEGKRRPHPRGVFNLLTAPDGWRIWWRMSIDRTGTFSAAAFGLDRPSVPISVKIVSAQSVLWSGPADRAAPAGFFHDTPGGAFSGSVPGLAYGRLGALDPFSRRISLRFTSQGDTVETAPLPVATFSTSFQSVTQLNELRHLGWRHILR